MARHTRTSSEAYAAIAPISDTLRAIAYRLIHEAGERGMTALEVVAASGRDRWSIQPRISELVSKDRVVDSGRTRFNPSGKRAIVWVIPDHARPLSKGERADG